MLSGKWWEIFKDPELNALEEKLTIVNQSIMQFFENLYRKDKAQRIPISPALNSQGARQRPLPLRVLGVPL